MIARTGHIVLAVVGGAYAAAWAVYAAVRLTARFRRRP